MKYELKANIPSGLAVDGKILRKGKPEELTESSHVKTLVGMGYIKPVPETTTKTKKQEAGNG